ncbi:hypothetical protein [Lutispora thermophila]|uniref:Uncharacterized protein n=1 Tax=Lutispora thermophila DSM 19022 TaxID=1122184 RepID=A0A1M6EVC2_9FIRM|nr:hypothetical protein [Lutispora thermophila]SHI89395.1 hypothetical protein SAMN02745176_01721 [Lutispora thermophila DSM 19022]
MPKKEKDHRNLRIASDELSSSEIHSVILRGVLCTFKSIFLSYYVSENIEALMNYINEKKIINPKEYKRLLTEAKDFYPVIICALFIPPIKAITKNYKLRSLDVDKKSELFRELYNVLLDFFTLWLCDVELDPLLYYRIGAAYNKKFDMGLYIKKQNSYYLTEIENQVLNSQIMDILCIYLIEEVAIQLGMAGLDYIDFYNNINTNLNSDIIKETNIS